MTNNIDFDQSGQYRVKYINWCDTTHFDSEDDYCTGCQNVSDCQQQSYQDYTLPSIISNLLIKKKDKYTNFLAHSAMFTWY